MARSYTAKLLAAQDKGATVVCSVAPYEGVRVEYEPGASGHHPSPWYVLGTGLRYSGRECHAVWPAQAA